MAKEQQPQQAQLGGWCITPQARDLLLAYLADRESSVAKDLTTLIEKGSVAMTQQQVAAITPREPNRNERRKAEATAGRRKKVAKKAKKKVKPKTSGKKPKPPAALKSVPNKAAS